MNSSDEIRRDFEAAKLGVMPDINNRIPMRPPVAEQFDDAKTPLTNNIETENKD